MKQFLVIIFILTGSFRLAFSMHRDELERQFLNRSPDEISYPYRDNCCAKCVHMVMVDDENEQNLRPSRMYHCLCVSCAVGTGVVALTAALVWVIGQHHTQSL